MIASPEIRNAASVILVRTDFNPPKVLMGKRGKKAVFMPEKYVFPGGAVEPNDLQGCFIPTSRIRNYHKLAVKAEIGLMQPLVNSALRELTEETGITISKDNIQDFGMAFVLRALTPTGMSRRFDTRFFIFRARENFDVRHFDTFKDASGELSDLAWFTLEEALDLDIPAITRKVIRFVKSINNHAAQLDSIPFYQEGSLEELTYL